MAEHVSIYSFFSANKIPPLLVIKQREHLCSLSAIEQTGRECYDNRKKNNGSADIMNAWKLQSLPAAGIR